MKALPGLLALLALLASGAVTAARAAGTISGFALPARQQAAALARVDRITAALARAFDAKLVRRENQVPPTLDDAAFAKAERLYRKVSFDAAAAASDQILDAAARDPARVTDGERLIALLVQRVSVALARGESQRPDQLLELLLRYDPDFALLPAEADPGLEHALVTVRRRLGPRRSLESGDVGDSCHAADMLVVARSLAHGVELARFDHCELIADTVATSEISDEKILAALAPPAVTARPPDLPAAARDRFEVGVGLQRIGKDAEAIREFSAGYALSSRPVFLLRIAESYRALRDASRAKEMYEKFLAEAPADASERTEAQRALSTIDGTAPARSPSSGSVDRSRGRRAQRIAGPSVLALGAIAVGLGGAFVGLAHRTSADANRSGSTFDPGAADRLGRYQAAEAACFAIGGVALLAGAVVTVIAYRR